MLRTAERSTTTDPALERRLERLGLTGHENQWTDRYLLCNHLVDPPTARSRQKFEATSRFIRDLVAHRWGKTRRAREEANPKRIHYLSMEFLLGRTLRNNMMNLAAEPIVRRAMKQEGWDLERLIEEEPDAGLGNGGLGRLAACFIDSLATLQYPAIGYGLRYEYGIFRQSIRDGWQIEQPDNWLRNTDPWEVVRPGKVYVVPLNASFELQGGGLTITRTRPSHSARHRLRSARGRLRRQLHQYIAALGGGGARIVRLRRILARRLRRRRHPERRRRVAYPRALSRTIPPTPGRALRFLQQYFMVSCSLQDIVAPLSQERQVELVRAAGPRRHPDERHAPGSVRGRVDADSARSGATALGSGLGHHPAHACLHQSHAAAGGPGALAGRVLRGAHSAAPRDHLRDQPPLSRRGPPPLSRRRGPVAARQPDRGRAGTQGPHGAPGGRRLAQHQRRGGDPLGLAPHARAARLRRDVSGALQQQDQRRHSPALAAAGQSIACPSSSPRRSATDWVTDLAQLRKLLPLAEDAGFREQFRDAKREAKVAFANWLKATSGQIVDPDTIFDSQIKRIHEYKRQLLNVLHIIVLYNRLRQRSPIRA